MTMILYAIDDELKYLLFSLLFEMIWCKGKRGFYFCGEMWTIYEREKVVI